MKMVAAVYNSQPGTQQKSIICVQHVVIHIVRVAICTAQHMTKSATAATRWVILPQFAGTGRTKQRVPISNNSQPVTNTVCLQSPQGDHIQL